MRISSLISDQLNRMGDCRTSCFPLPLLYNFQLLKLSFKNDSGFFIILLFYEIRKKHYDLKLFTT